MKRLLGEGKLSLIVDLDQTLIHAAVGASIDEWVNAQGQLPRVKKKKRRSVRNDYVLHRAIGWDSQLKIFLSLLFFFCQQDIKMFPLPDAATPYYIKLRLVAPHVLS